MSEEIIKMLLEQIKEKDRRIRELEEKLEELSKQGQTLSHRDVKPLLEQVCGQELSDEVKGKIEKAIDFVIKHGRSIPYIGG